MSKPLSKITQEHLDNRDFTKEIDSSTIRKILAYLPNEHLKVIKEVSTDLLDKRRGTQGEAAQYYKRIYDRSE